MPSLALFSAIIMGFYLTTFLALTIRPARESGQAIWLFGRDRRQGLPAWLFRLAFAGGFFYPLLIACGVAPVMEFAAPPAALRAAGLLLALAGAFLAAYAQHHMGASWRIGSVKGHSGAIVDTGPFRLSRNPVFVGQVALFAGFLLARPDIVQLALAAAVTLAVSLQVRIEEKVLERDLGAPYRAYASRVRRWL